MNLYERARLRRRREIMEERLMLDFNSISQTDKSKAMPEHIDFNANTFRNGVNLEIIKFKPSVFTNPNLTLDFSNCVKLKQIRIYNQGTISEINLVKSTNTSTIELKDLLSDGIKNIQYKTGDSATIDRSSLGLCPIVIKFPNEKIQSTSVIIDIEDVLKNKNIEYEYILDANNNSTLSIDRSFVGMPPIFVNLVKFEAKNYTEFREKNDRLIHQILDPGASEVTIYYSKYNGTDDCLDSTDTDALFPYSEMAFVRKSKRDFNPLSIVVLDPESIES